jgi:hypothetical protein
MAAVRGSGLLRQPTKSWRGCTRRNSLTSLGTGDPGRAVVVVVRQRPHPRGGDRGARLRGAGVEASGRVEVCPLEQGPDLARPGRTPQPSLCYRPRSRLTPTSTCTHEDEHAPGEAALDRGARSGGNLRRRAPKFDQERQLGSSPRTLRSWSRPRRSIEARRTPSPCSCTA